MSECERRRSAVSVFRWLASAACSLGVRRSPLSIPDVDARGLITAGGSGEKREEKKTKEAAAESARPRGDLWRRGAAGGRAPAARLAISRTPSRTTFQIKIMDVL